MAWKRLDGPARMPQSCGDSVTKRAVIRCGSLTWIPTPAAETPLAKAEERLQRGGASKKCSRVQYGVADRRVFEKEKLAGVGVAGYLPQRLQHRPDA